MQAPFLGWSVQALAGVLPRRQLACTKQMHYASGFSGKRTPRVRLCGRSTHEATTRRAMEPVAIR